MGTAGNPPRLRLVDPDAEQKTRRATWLELFSDLVFVVAVAELAHLLADQVSGSRMLAYAGLFVPVWWAWVGGTFYNNRFDSDDTLHRILTLAQVLGVAVLAGTLAVLAILHLCSDRPAKATPRLVGALLSVASAMLAGESGSLLLQVVLASVVAAQVGLELVKKARLT